MDAVIAGHGQIVGKDGVGPCRAVLLPRASRNLNHTPPKYTSRKIVLILASGLTGFTTGAERSIEGESVGHSGFKVGRLNVESLDMVDLKPLTCNFQFQP